MAKRTRLKEVSWMAFAFGRVVELPIMVRVTKDSIGKTLSLSTESGIMLAIPLEPVEDMIDVVD